MTTVNLLHNPGAGTEDHSSEELIYLLRKNGFECQYFSMDEKGWDKFDENADFIVAAGGDGTIRKITKKLLDKKSGNKLPIALLPLGTANNIAQTLEINGSTDEIIESWKNARIKKFDVGRIYNIESSNFFLESFGYGLFPYLIKKIKKIEGNGGTSEIEKALAVLHEIIFSYSPKFCKLKIDDVDLSGKFLLVEIMNTQLMGPNLFLSPHGDPGDGQFDIILIPERDKEQLASYVLNKLKGTDVPYTFQQLKGKDIIVGWEGTHVHIDGDVAKLDKNYEV
ncbi:MAG TPA: diacylglycerol kinase family protein, partial [Chitinophagaceae bacterium]